ncbi:MAG: sodium:solute symporter family protein [Burkholderiales bacterium]|jgi:cation/acetate symporter|nr:Acetate transporter ActP [Betaproteobacteria bacterium MOLA814]
MGKGLPYALGSRAWMARLNKLYLLYTLAFVSLVAVLGVLEQMGMPRSWIGFVFLIATIGVYAAIGLVCRTTDATEYYVAGRSVPAVYNGMATGADWMSAASFIGMAGTLYISGYTGLAFVLGWTGGYVLVALLLAPYLRKFGQFTIPDFLGERYGGHIPRLIGVVAVILVSFTYVVAQIYGVGLITSRLTGVAFELGVFLGLGGILVCSFLGGMRAVTWTQVAQYIVLIVAFLIPVMWLSIKQTSSPVPQLSYGYQLAQVGQLEQTLISDPKELEVQAIFAQRAKDLEAKLHNPASALRADRKAAQTLVASLKAAQAPLNERAAAERVLATMPRTLDGATSQWRAQLEVANTKMKPLNGMTPHAQPFAGDPDGSEQERDSFETSRRNFIALVFCLVFGTAALPHVLVRYYTTPSVRAARQSVTWSLFFILLLYLTAPALAVMVKYEIFNGLVGSSFDNLPAWVSAWSKVDPSLLSLTDINKDGLVQLNELSMGSDIIVLATPEIAGLPYVVSGLIAAGGLAAALSTADGLLLTVANALSHDLYYKLIDPTASTARRVTISKMLLLVVALAAAYVAAQKPADILFLVSAAFSLAASAFFPVLTLGIFWKRANSTGAILGMLSGLGMTIFYMATTHPWLRQAFGMQGEAQLWWGIQSISAGVFGVPVGFAVLVIASLLTPAPPLAVQRMVQRLRYAGPDL